ncbi:MAG: HipA family kinase [Hyphomicrobiaceae bacterium]
MLETVNPVRFHAAVTSGRTRPARVECQKSDETLVEVIAKFAGGCDRGETALAMEVVAACLAADLGLPIPTPYLLAIDPAWVRTIPDAAYRDIVARSGAIAYGSTDVGSDYRAWTSYDRLTPQLMPVALAIFCFDAFINNSDRRDGNPNCLRKDEQLRIFDHELTFLYKGVLLWREPWKVSALAPFASPGRHIFQTKLKGQALDMAPVRAAWAALSDGRLASYKGSLPAAWSNTGAAVDDAISLIQGVRNHIDDALAEVRRVLT